MRSASLSNSGQICNALTRVLVPERRHDEYVDALAAEMTALRVGDPSDPDTQIGPLVSQRQQQRVRGYIQTGQHEGAQLVIGGTDMPDGLERGWYVQPTLFAARRQHHAHCARRDLRAGDHRHPLSRRGRGGGHCQRLRLRARRVGVDGRHRRGPWRSPRRIRTGTLGVNQGYTMDPFAPFGGVKGSGYGRELGPEGLDGYLDMKSIAVAASA